MKEVGEENTLLPRKYLTQKLFNYEVWNVYIEH